MWSRCSNGVLARDVSRNSTRHIEKNRVERVLKERRWRIRKFCNRFAICIHFSFNVCRQSRMFIIPVIPSLSSPLPNYATMKWTTVPSNYRVLEKEKSFHKNVRKKRLPQRCNNSFRPIESKGFVNFLNSFSWGRCREMILEINLEPMTLRCFQ